MKEIKTWDDVVGEKKQWKKKPIIIEAVELTEDIMIYTREGELMGYKGDFLILGIKGEIYPCGREIFFQTYDGVNQNKGEPNKVFIEKAVNVTKDGFNAVRKLVEEETGEGNGNKN